MAPSCEVTRSVPRRTTVYSSNSGVCPGSTQPGGLCMRATETAAVSLFTRPMYSSIRFGLFPAASMTFGELMCVGMRRSLLRPQPAFDGREHVRLLLGRQRLTLRDAVRLLQASAAAGRGRMLRDKHRVVAPRRLPPVVARLGRREALVDEARRLLHHALEAPRPEIRALAAGELELTPERGGAEAAKDLIHVEHRRSRY